ncbi:MAG: PAS domain S-box protein [Draconibacterium sp.]
MKILVIDDNEDNLISIKAIVSLVFPEAKLLLANHGKPGIELAVKENPDVILLDILMPGMDGFEVCKALKSNEDTSLIPVVFLTAMDNDNRNRIKALDTGAEAIISKPVDETELQMLLKTMLKIKTANRLMKNENVRLNELVAERTLELEQQNRQMKLLVNDLQEEISLHQKTLTELQQSEEKFRKLFENHSAIKLLVDPDNGQIIDANIAATEFYGWEREQLQQMNIKQINTLCAADVEKAMARVRKQKRNFFEFKHRLATGEIRDVAVYTSGILVNGKLLLHSIIHDISEQHRIHNALVTNEERLKRAELASKTGNWELHLDTFIIFGSEGAKKIYGVDNDKFNYSFIKEMPFLEYRPLLDNALKQLIENATPYNVDFKIKAYDTGEIKDIHSEAVFNKERRTVFGIIQDVTDWKLSENKLKASEEKYRLITENTSDVIWILNLSQMKFTYISPSIFHLRGFTVEEAMNQSLNESLTPKSQKMVEETLSKTVPEFLSHKNTGLTRSITQIQQPCKDGSIIWVEVATHFQMNSAGEIEVLGVSRNIEERKKMEDELRRGELELRELVATKDKFFSIIAHDLKSPFNSIIGFSDLLQTEAISLDVNDIIQYSRLINTSAKNTMVLLENLLDWAQLQRGQMLFNPKRLLLSELMKEALELVSQSAVQKNISIHTHAPENLIIVVDENMFKLLIRNLVGNAVKFTQSGGKVDINVKMPDDRIQISVKDNGIGISAENIGKLFNISTGYVARGTANEKGTGLGLILCREFVEKHGGRIWVESIEGKGSTFIFELPLKND